MDNYKHLFCTDLTDVQKELYVELSDIYKGLRFCRKSVSCVNLPNKTKYISKSEIHLLLAVNLCESHKTDFIDEHDRNTQELLSVINISFKSTPLIIVETNVSGRKNYHNVELNTKRKSTAKTRNSDNEQNCLLYSRSVDEKIGNTNCVTDKIGENRNINFPLQIYSDAGNAISFYNEWPGRCPTVNISWFIAKAYLANLYYTTQRDVSLTIQTCDDILYVYGQSEFNKYFAESTLPVVLSTQWTGIYDKKIQELLGFYSLCSYVLDKSSSRSVYLGVCPVLFAHYVKVRSAKDQWFDIKTENNLTEYARHRDVECYCDRTVSNGTRAVDAALLNNYYLNSFYFS